MLCCSFDDLHSSSLPKTSVRSLGRSDLADLGSAGWRPAGGHPNLRSGRPSFPSNAGRPSRRRVEGGGLFRRPNNEAIRLGACFEAMEWVGPPEMDALFMRQVSGDEAPPDRQVSQNHSHRSENHECVQWFQVYMTQICRIRMDHRVGFFLLHITGLWSSLQWF